MRRGVHGAVVLLLGAMMATLWVALGPGTPARAQTVQPVFTRYDETLSLDAQGVATVVIDATFDTGNGSSAGPALSFPRRVEVPPAQGRPRFRQLTNTITDVTSPSGAPTGVRHTSTVDTDLYRIGDQTNRIRGVQHYRVSLRIDGLVTPTDSGDELAWEAVDAVDTLARNEASFTIEAPGAATSSRCATDLQPAGSCPITSNDSGVSASVRDLAAADAVRINVTYPSGTFTDVSEDYTVHRTLADRFPLTAVDIIGGLAFGLIGLIGSVGYALTQGRDRRWDSSHAGDRKPPPDTRVVTGRRRRVPLRTEPPEQTLPGEVGFLLETHTETDQITATLIDLAVRGFLTVHREDDSSWTFRRTQTDASTLATYERTVLKRLFPKVKGRIRVTSSTGEASRAKGSFTTTREAIARRVGTLGWFRVPPDKARFRSHRFGVVICMFGLLTLIPFVGFMGLGLWSAGIILAGICVLAIMPFTPSRTPGQRRAGTGRGLPPVPVRSRSRADRLEAQRRCLQPLPALGGRVRRRRPVDRAVPEAHRRGPLSPTARLVREPARIGVGHAGPYRGAELADQQLQPRRGRRRSPCGCGEWARRLRMSRPGCTSFPHGQT